MERVLPECIRFVFPLTDYTSSLKEAREWADALRVMKLPTYEPLRDIHLQLAVSDKSNVTCWHMIKVGAVDPLDDACGYLCLWKSSLRPMLLRIVRYSVIACLTYHH